MKKLLLLAAVATMTLTVGKVAYATVTLDTQNVNTIQESSKYFTDENVDGICDNYDVEKGTGNGIGICDGTGKGTGNGTGICDGTGKGTGNGTGICDGICKGKNRNK